MVNLDKINVIFNGGGTPIKLGQLILENNRIFFKYDEAYLVTGYNISPFKLKFDASIQFCDISIFDGLFGVFADSLPDGWGRLLMDRFLMSQNKSIGLNPLQKLSLIGVKGPGALEYLPSSEYESDLNYTFDLDNYFHKISKIYDGSFEDILPIYLQGGSSGGARPKILVNYNPVKNDFSFEDEKGYSPWIVKFQVKSDPADNSKIEYIYYLMASRAGITMNESRLFITTDNCFFGTKRFDRIEYTKVHFTSAAGLLHDNFRYSTMDYGNLMDSALQLTKKRDSISDIMRIAMFNVLSHNLDDHSKNIGFLMASNGAWSVAPAYDLTFSTSSHGYQSTFVAGINKDIKYRHFEELAKHFGMSDLTAIFNQVKLGLSYWSEYAKKYKVNKIVANTISNQLKTKLNIFIA